MKNPQKTNPKISKEIKFIAILFLIFNLICVNAYAQTDDAYKSYRKACALLDTKKYPEAIVEFDKAIALNPKMQYVYGYRGSSYHQLKKFDKAMEDYKKDELAYPAHSSYNMACALSLLGKKEDALKWLEISQKSEFRQSQETVEADADFENVKKDARFIKIAKTDYRNDYEKLMADGDKFYYSAKDYKAAVEAFTKVINKDAQNAVGYRARANAYSELGEFDKAWEDFDKAIALKDKDAWYCYFRKARIVSKVNEKVAFQNYQKAYELNPRWEGDFDVAMTYFKNGNKDAAISICQEIGDNYNNGEFLGYAAFFMLQKGTALPLALEYANKAIRIDPNFTITYGIRARLLNQLKRYQEAVVDFTKAIEYEPNNGDLYYERGIAKVSVSVTKKPEACADWKKAISLGYKDKNNYYADFCK